MKKLRLNPVPKLNSQKSWLFVDIECDADTAEVYGSRHEPHIKRYLKFGGITGFAVKWFNGTRIYVYDLKDFGGSERKILLKLIWWIDQCDYFIAHNGDKFDLKVINARLDALGLPQLSPIKTIDTLKWSRKLWKLASHSLDFLGQYFGLGRKLERPHSDEPLTEKERQQEKRYNANDVLILSKLFALELQHIGHLAPFKEPKQKSLSANRQCPHEECRSWHTQSRGQRIISGVIYYQFQCRGCFKWFYKL